MLWKAGSLTGAAACYMMKCDVETIQVNRVREKETDERLGKDQVLNLQPLAH